ncbi:MAG TPA: bifunctional 2-polyprenyl-6-hydroxyphenol methylase/3-demethylubiquinol 3-O-methyltransferase UbiG [Alphaproteobacteria bacterium]|nr:bifunctional 2-polyprenyl-6-hydroxyphenol methylase/3-demethylubiquinol 3-O-methyltransferase UbiG [Alphaproteobacteria bacterium]HQS93532.1 bifunctional 2-polyprenyl-6-hydroxyphenol methylase/3-demethylubiquinol 3-O-methyltransferase UbiG [Alphaproteobacteria bacterium]
MVSSLNPSEINHFRKLADHWWEEKGPFSMLHQLNPLRVQYIKNALRGELKGLKILDVGCGGGILAEPLARLGANVTGLDVVLENIEVASRHAEAEGLKIQYKALSLEDYLKTTPSKFDVVLALEVLEHVENPKYFLETCASALKEEGSLFVSTFHRTAKSYLLGIVMAEYVLKWVPKKTHHWTQFLKPSEIYEALREDGFVFEDLVGVTYDLWKSNWKISQDTSVNYMGLLRRKLT